jgi:hypothetical protein
MIAETEPSPPHDPLRELKWLMVLVAHEHYQAMQSGEGFPPLPGKNLDSPRLREAFSKFADQLRENRVDIDKLRRMDGDLGELLSTIESLREQWGAVENLRELLLEKIGKLQEQLLEDRADIDQLQSRRSRPPNKSTLVREAFCQALRDCGISDDLVGRAFDRFQFLYEPASLDTQRVRRSRTKATMSQSKPK